jgi:hypothetical protein
MSEHLNRITITETEVSRAKRAKAGPTPRDSRRLGLPSSRERASEAYLGFSLSLYLGGLLSS